MPSRKKKKIYIWKLLLTAFLFGFAFFHADATGTSARCILVLTKSVDKTEGLDGDILTYTIRYRNDGTAMCTGGGVRIEDTVPAGLTFVNETHSPWMSSGYNGVPLYTNSTRVLSWNAHEVSPGLSGEISWTARVTTSSCSGETIRNKARISSNEYNWQWVWSNEVSTTVKRNCPQPLTLQCAVSPSAITTGGSLVWSSSVSGGTLPISFSWSGSDGLSGNTASVTKSYSTVGTKKGRVTATDALGQTLTRECEVVVNEEVITIPSCPFEPRSGRVVVQFPTSKKIVANASLSSAENGPVAASLPAGAYSVSLASFDGYVGRENKTQLREQWYAKLTPSNGADPVMVTGTISDLEDGVRTAFKTEVVNERLILPSSVNSVTARHAAFSDPSEAHSVYALCAAFDVIPEDTEELVGDCSVEPARTRVNESVTWLAQASGGTLPISFSWSGSDGLSGNTASVAKSYSTVGVKEGTVTISSGDESLVRTCEVVVGGDVTPPPPPPPPRCSTGCGGGGFDPPTVVLVKTATSSGATVYVSQISFTSTSTGRVAGVFLSQLPYTGVLADYGSLIIFAIGVLFWSAIVAYAIRNRWHRKILRLFAVLNATDSQRVWDIDQVQGSSEMAIPEPDLTPHIAAPLFGNPYADIARTPSTRPSSFESPRQTVAHVSSDGSLAANTPPVQEQASVAAILSEGDRSGQIAAHDDRAYDVPSSPTWMKYQPIRHTLHTLLIREAQKERVIISDAGFEVVINAGDGQEGETLQILRQLIRVADTTIPRDGGWLNLNADQIQKILFSTYMSMSAIFIEWLVKGEAQSAFAFIRTLKQQKHPIDEFLTEIVSALDAVFRGRIEGNERSYDPHIAESVKAWSDDRLQEVIAVLIGALDRGYASIEVGAKLALVKLFASRKGKSGAPEGRFSRAEQSTSARREERPVA